MLVETFNIFSSKENCVLVTKRFLKHFKIKETSFTIESKILQHPDHLSLLSIYDTIEDLGLEAYASELDKKDIEKIEEPFITQIDRGNTNTFFIYVYAVTDTTISFYDEIDKQATLTIDEFLNLWTGVSLFAEPNKEILEKEPSKELASKKWNYSLVTLLTIIIVAGLFSYSIYIYNNTNNSFFTLSFLVLKLIGLATGTILLWYEIDNYNPVIQNICSFGKKVNCGAVLNSKGSKLFGKHLSWSEVGFSYFFGTTLFLIATSILNNEVGLLAFISVLSIPFILYSLYYQLIKIKQFCVLCLITQVVLLGEVILVFTSNQLHFKSISFISIFFLAFLLLTPIVSWKVIYPLLQTSKAHLKTVRRLNQLKNNPQIFSALLQHSEKMKLPTNGLGISFKNEHAKVKIVKVCNPYCSPCANAHPILEELLEKGLIDLQIIFNASTKENDKRFDPVNHLMAIASKKEDQVTREALDDWYLSETKDYQTFSNKYLLNGELELQNKKIEAMYNWCLDEKITHTPTIYVNGYQLPSEYQITDLQNILK